MKFTVAHSILSIITVFFTAWASPDLKVVNKDANSVTLAFTLRVEMKDKYGFDKKKYTMFQFNECATDIDSLTGELDVVRKIPLVLPSPRYTITIIEASAQVFSIINYPTAAAFISPSIHAARANAAPEYTTAKVDDIAQRNGYYAGTLVVNPVEKIDQHRVRIYSRLVVKVSFDGSLPNGVNALALQNWDTALKLNKTASIGKTKNAQPRKLSLNQSAATFASSPLAHGAWYRMSVSEDGIYKLDYNFFKNNGIPSDVWSTINKIHVYGNGGAPAPEDLSQYPASYPLGLQEIARLVVDNNGNGIFDQGDYIVFYGRAPNGWTYFNSAQTYTHYVNPYSLVNYYFLTSSGTDGISMDTVASVATADTLTAYPATDFTGRVFVEENKTNLLNSGTQWVGRLFNSSTTSATYTNSLPGLVSNSSILYRFLFYSRSVTSDKVNITENGNALTGDIYFSPVSDISSNQVPYATQRNFTTSFNSNGIAGALSSLRIDYTQSGGNQNANAWLGWIEILYRHSYTATGDYLFCSSPDINALVKYSVTGLNSPANLVLDISNHANVKRVTNWNVNNGACQFYLSQTSGNVRELAVVGSNGFKNISGITKINVSQDLPGIAVPYDLIIITPDDFIAEATRLKTYRETHDTIKTLVVDIQDIFNEFSGGLVDPMGIRNFLCYAYNNWSYTPHYVLLFGSGHCDYRNIGTSLPNWVVPYETNESMDQIYSYTSDDHFVLLRANDPRPTMAIGRLPVRNEPQAVTVVDKIISYETQSPQDIWRNNVTLVGDDEFATRLISDSSVILNDTSYLHYLYQPIFCEGTEILANYYIPSSFNKTKILLPAYQDEASASGRQKPKAAADIVNAINGGTLLCNYIGHANEFIWSHTEVFSQASSLPALVNKTKLAAFFVAGCSYALFDNPSELSAGEQLITMEQGGAIVEIASSRVVYDDENESLDQLSLGQIFHKDSLGNSPRIGDVMLTVKQSDNGVNSQKFHLLGDPTVRLLAPAYNVSIDSVNGLNANTAVSAKMLGHVKIKGSIQRNNKKDASFKGTGYFNLYDAYKVLKFSDFPSYDSFFVMGSTLYSGTVSIDSGTYELLAPIPKDVSSGRQSRMALYAFETGKDASGSNEMITISGIDTSAPLDVTGPQISIYLNDAAFKSGDAVAPNAQLIVRLADSNGINTSTAGVGHQLAASITNPTQVLDLSGYYRGDANTYQSGQVAYPLQGMQEGKHTVTVKAWDIYNNSSQAEIDFIVKSGNESAMSDVFNYPNPFTYSTSFTFQRNSTEPIDIEVKVYSIAGRLIRSIKSYANADRFVRIPWDGTDAEGAAIANGIYLYKITTKSLSTNDGNEYIGKLARVR